MDKMPEEPMHMGDITAEGALYVLSLRARAEELQRENEVIARLLNDAEKMCEAKWMEKGIDSLQTSLGREREDNAILRSELTRARADALEEACRAVCRYCKEGRKPDQHMGERGGWWHYVARGGDLGDSAPCTAHAIRALIGAPNV